MAGEDIPGTLEIMKAEAISFIISLGIIFLFIVLALYIYISLSLKSIAKKLNYNKPWLTFIPIARNVVILRLGNFSGLWIFLILVPVIGWLTLCVLMIISFWRIAKKRNLPGWIALLLILPIVNLITLGILAWYEKDKKKILVITAIILIIFIIIPIFSVITLFHSKAWFFSDKIYNSASSPEIQFDFYKGGGSHFVDFAIMREYRELKEMGINTYVVGGEALYVDGVIGIEVTDFSKAWPLYYVKNWKARASYLMNKAHKDNMKTILSLGETDWGLAAPKYTKIPKEQVSQETIDLWLENYTRVVGNAAKFAEESKADIFVFGATQQMIRIEKPESETQESYDIYRNSLYEKFLREMLKEARKYYHGKIGVDIASAGFGKVDFVPEVGKIDYILFNTVAHPLDVSDAYDWTELTLEEIENIKKVFKNSDIEGIALQFDFTGNCEYAEKYSKEERRKLYDDLIENTKDKLIGYIPLTTPLLSCDRDLLLEVLKEQYGKL